MADRSFLDTNILVYTDDAGDARKRAIALDLIERVRRERAGVVSVQVLQEYFVASTRKLSVDAELARRKVELFARMDVVQPGLEQILAAIDLVRLDQISFWDALVVRSAIDGRCRVLYSEDMQAGRRFGGVRILNPFE
jgi:predicted nucleic acid-binding protein